MPAYADLNKFEAEQWGEFGIGSAAQFGSADLKRANFTSADMRESDFSGSTFNGAYMEKVVAYRANFTGADLSDTLMDRMEAEELVTLAPDKMLLKWMKFHIKKAGYKKTVTNFSSDVKDGEAYAYLLSALAPEHTSTTMIETVDSKGRAKKVLETAEKLDCTRYVTTKDIVEGSANLNLAFVAQIFQQR